MYTPKVAGISTVAAATTGAVLLPNTGSNVVIQLAIAVAAGLVVWGALYLSKQS